MGDGVAVTLRADLDQQLPIETDRVENVGGRVTGIQPVVIGMLFPGPVAAFTGDSQQRPFLTKQIRAGACSIQVVWHSMHRTVMFRAKSPSPKGVQK